MTGKPFNLVCEDYTVYLTVGASNCGKSYLSKNIELHLRSNGANPLLISSDDIRRELIGDFTMDKYDDRMLEVSQQAFELLYAKLKFSISYPVNRKFVIIDSTGLNDKFRQDIISICNSNNYKVVCLLFEYKDRKDWFVNPGGNNYVINNHINKLQKFVYKEIRAKDYHKIVRITAPIDEINITYIEDKNNLKVEGNNYTVIGDVHGCVDELKELVSRVDNTPILVGDWIDVKDPMLNKSAHYNERIIDYLLANSQILLVKGNHEENLFKYISKIENTPQEELEDFEFSSFMENNKYFNSRFLVNISLSYRAKFIELYNRSYSSIRGDGFIVTHAPCKAKYLLTSVDKMTNLYYKTEEKSDLINAIYDSRFYNTCWPLQLYGHLTFEKPVRNKYSIGLDTGVGYGGLLTGYNVATKQFITVKSFADDSVKQLESITKFKQVIEDLSDKLDEDDSKKLASFIRNKVPYVSGTICPADKYDNELEDIRTALLYFKNKGQTKVLIQPKYMGSRAQVLLTKDGASVYTRNGFKLRMTDELAEAVKRLYISLNLTLMGTIANDPINVWLNSLGPFTSILLDCELMPWSYLSTNLIRDIFEAYYYSHKTHMEAMSSYGFYDDLIAYRNSEAFKEPSNNKEVTNFRHWRYVDNTENLTAFGKELDKYSVVEDVYFMPFNILKVESEDKVLYSNSEFNRFDNKELLSLLGTPLHEVDVNDLEAANEIVSKYSNLEGVVVKPYYNSEGQAPYIKVRNKDYLRLVYGYDYINNLEKLLDDKKIGKKLSISINEWQYGNNLLDIHSSNQTEDNMEYTNNLIKLIFELKSEQRLDPRL